MKKARKSWAFLALVMVLLCAASAFAVAEEYAPFGEFAALNINSNGGEVTDAIFGEAKYTIMHFFSSWDELCMAELPFLEIINSQGNGDFQIVCVQIDSVTTELMPNMDAVGTVIEAIDEMSLTYPILQMFGDTLLSYGAVITTVPTNVIVYQDGDIIDTFTGAMDFSEWVDYCIWLTAES